MESRLDCRIRVAGELGQDLADWFDGVAVEPVGDGTTEIAGSLPDQAAVFGLLAGVRDLGIEVLTIEVRRRDAAAERCEGTGAVER